MGKKFEELDDSFIEYSMFFNVFIYLLGTSKARNIRESIGNGKRTIEQIMNEIEIALGDNEVDENSYFGQIYGLTNKILEEHKD